MLDTFGTRAPLRYPRSEAERANSPFVLLGSNTPGPRIPPVHRTKRLTQQTDPRFRMGKCGGSNHRNIVGLDRSIAHPTANPTVAGWSRKTRLGCWLRRYLRPVVKKLRPDPEAFSLLTGIRPSSSRKGKESAVRHEECLYYVELRCSPFLRHIH